MKDLHTHTTYCDGKNTPEEMVKEAIHKGMETIGFSVHAYTDFDLSYCIKKEKVDEYKREINRLKEAYKDKIEVLCGAELDLFHTMDISGLDYKIGSVHYVRTKDGLEPIDMAEESFLKIAEKMGGFYELAENYYEHVARLGEVNPDIIGHFDLVTKYNEADRLFDTKNPRYVSAWKKAADALIPLNVPFEINTGAISRGVRKTPYPAPEIIDYLKEKGAKLILNGDTHAKENLCYQFDKWKKLL